MSKLSRLGQRRLLLDTHVWLWLVSGDKKLASTFVEAVDKAQARGEVLISPMSIWEIGMLVEKGRVELGMDRLAWIESLLSTPGVELAAVTPRCMIQSTRLPGEVHGDPVDRILMATAREASAVLVTADAKILSFGEGRFINVYNPTT